MNKEDFFDRLDGAVRQLAKRNMEPKGLRVNGNNDPFNPLWKIWIVGPGSVDETLVLAWDIWPVANYRSLEKAEKELTKFRRWFAEWEHETAKI
ncbi:hypothetical protein CB7_46 [Pectobacterium phage vB_PatM_CB7]|nr:hypothetical protein CB7_46 [Pectobacterium phage vB_PatM_CB7]